MVQYINLRIVLLSTVYIRTTTKITAMQYSRDNPVSDKAKETVKGEKE